jgi:hypothetical protein
MLSLLAMSLGCEITLLTRQRYLKQNKTKQNKTKQNKTKQNKTKQNVVNYACTKSSL